VGVFAFGQLKRAKIRNTKLVMHSLQQALVHFQTNSGETCPKTLGELREQKYLDKDGADIVSRGEDKQDGTADDLKSWPSLAALLTTDAALGIARTAFRVPDATVALASEAEQPLLPHALIA
jgi:hypothetical protein